MIRKTLVSRFQGNKTAIEHFGDMLERYERSGLAAPNFSVELATGEDKKFWSGVWEAMLFRHLSSLNFEFLPSRSKKSGQHGPDFGLRYSSSNIWIEATVPEPIGIPEDYLKPPSSDPTVFEVKTEPHEEKLLRWTAAIKKKKEKFEKYLNDGVVSKHDCLVIAVNSCCLQDFAIDDMGISRLPYAVEATFPVGPLAIPLNIKGEQTGPAQNIWRGSLKNANGAQVRTDNFLDKSFEHISAVIGTHQRDLFDKKLSLSLVHNPLARIPLPSNIVSATKEFACVLGESDFTLSRFS